MSSRLGAIHESDEQADGRTDGRTDTGQQLVPRLRITSRGWNMTYTVLGLHYLRACLGRRDSPPVRFCDVPDATHEL